MAFSSGTVTRFLYIVIFITAFNVQATEDDYLKLLEQEASDLHLDQSGQRESDGAVHSSSTTQLERKWDGECEYSSDILLPDIDRAEFASYLKQCYLGTYAYYKRLDVNLQKAVYDSYKKNTPIKHLALKKEIVNYF